MVPKIEANELLDALGEPALLVSPGGLIVESNAVAILRAGRKLSGKRLSDFAGNDAVATYLMRCSRTSGTLMGAVQLPENDALRKYRCYGKLLRAADPTLIFLRCSAGDDDQFLLLNRRITALNDEVRNHRHTQAVLEEALRERELLVREIHHRVKNNIQIIQSILNNAAIEAPYAEAKICLQDAARRMTAMASVQQALYRADQLADCQAHDFLGALIPALQSTWPKSIEIDYNAESIRLSGDIATPLALIISELTTNALKYGIGDRTDGIVSIRLYVEEDRLVLAVHDDGPGFVLGEVRSRASGLGLVRGLARQVGGSFEVFQEKGSLCVVRLPFLSDLGG